MVRMNAGDDGMPRARGARSVRVDGSGSSGRVEVGRSARDERPGELVHARRLGVLVERAGDDDLGLPLVELGRARRWSASAAMSLRIRRVADADHGDVVRHPQTEHVRRVDRRDRREVGRRVDRGRPPLAREQLDRRLNALACVSMKVEVNAGSSGSPLGEPFDVRRVPGDPGRRPRTAPSATRHPIADVALEQVVHREVAAGQRRLSGSRRSPRARASRRTRRAAGRARRGRASLRRSSSVSTAPSR